MRTTSAVPTLARTAALLGGLLLAAPAGAGAQQVTSTVDPRFQPWMGCWRPVDGGIGLEELDRAQQPTRACVVPSTQIAGSVDIVLLRRDSVMSRTAVPRPGTPAPRSLDDCEGTESSQWTSDGQRLVLQAKLTCAQGVSRVETGLMTLSATGQWVQVQHMAVGKNEATVVARFRFDGDTLLPTGLAVGSQRSTRALRLATGAPVALTAVMETARLVPQSLAEAWLVDRGQRFEVNAKALTAMADGGVAPRVLDVLVALANPHRYRIGGAAPVDQAGFGVAQADIATLRTRGASVNAMNTMNRCGRFDSFCYGPGGLGAWGFGYWYGLNDWYGAWTPWGYRYGGPYGAWGFNNGWGSPWGAWGPGGVYYGGGPVVIGPANPGGSSGSAGSGSGEVRGRAVNGGGYTRAGRDPSSSASPSSFPSSGMGSSMGGGSSVGEGGGGDGGRTAKPRPPR